MNPLNPWFWLAGLAFVAICCAGTARITWKYCEGEHAKETVKVQEKIIYRDNIIIKEVPKIVTKVVTREVEVTKEVERVVTKINDLVAPDCVLPDGIGLSLVAAANGVDPTAPGVADEIAGRYSCVATLEAVLSDLRAGWVNTTRLAGLQEWATLVTKPQ